MGRPKKAVAPDAPAAELAVFLRELRERSNMTYAQMTLAGAPSVPTLSRTDSGELVGWPAVEAYARACGASPAQMNKTERLWKEATERPAVVSRGVTAEPRWIDPDQLVEPHQLGEVMRAARAACENPSYRALEKRAAAIGVTLCRSTISDALNPAKVPTPWFFRDFMLVIGLYPGSPAARYDARTWEQAWERAHGRYPGSPAKAPAEPEPGPGGTGDARLPPGRAGMDKGRRAPRLMKAPWTPPGPLRVFTETLYELYLAAGAPSLADIETSIRADDSLPAAPKRDSVRRVLRSTRPPASPGDAEAVAAALAHMAGRDQGAAAERVRELWTKAAAEPAFGRAIADLAGQEPLLGIHPAFPIAGGANTLPTLTPYVPRLHDLVLEAVVQRGVGGHSGIVIAYGAPKSGKSRSCWEAVRGLPSGWRLWHPPDPSDTQQVIDALRHAGPNTVVWLDSLDQHLDAHRNTLAPAARAEIRSAIADGRRAPILVVGTMPDDAPLFAAPADGRPDTNAAARDLIDSAAVNVPPRFTTAESQALEAMADRDPRLGMAAAQANGEVAQYLASDHTHPMLKADTYRAAVDDGDTDTLLLGGTLLQEDGQTAEAAAWYQAAAEAGDSQAVQFAANMLDASGCPADALAWLRRLADGGDADAALEAARRLKHDGEHHHAIALYQRAAELGSTDGLRAAAALMHRTDRTNDALAWLREMADAGHQEALRESAHLLWATGDQEGALLQFEKSVTAGETAALLETAELLESVGRVDDAARWYKWAIDCGYDTAIYALAELLKADRRDDEALTYYKMAAERLSDKIAMRNVAAIHRLREEYDDALEWYTKAADHGDSTSLVHVATLYQTEKKDLAMALAWYTKAADQHQRDAYREAAWMLWQAENFGEAFTWLKHRADNGDSRALREMGDLLRESGQLREALVWYTRAAQKGSEYSANQASVLKARLGTRFGNLHDHLDKVADHSKETESNLPF